MQNKRKIKGIICVILCVLWVAFIFSNSFDSGNRSSAKSGAVVAVLQWTVDIFTDDVTVDEGFVRTMGHFSEFAILGFLVLLTVKMFTEKYLQNVFIALFTVLAVAVTDEFLQLFSDGRVADILDVLVDFAGAVTGMLFFVFIINVPNIILKIKDSFRRRKEIGRQQ